ncbi:DUF3923 family protein [Companilactobacillus keshanensis]|uniref:DUF3923 family protein n=1 Tax=Companilactobacillus keshanensis TaxID=2486003 RepID=A0ABW4BTT4_9LACO|nr:DUF3923 family protein [Companilactobacillus keshanensis]
MSKWRTLSLSWIVIFAIGVVVIFVHSINSAGTSNTSTLKLGSLVIWVGIFILIAIVQTVAYTVYNLLSNNKTPH